MTDSSISLIKSNYVVNLISIQDLLVPEKNQLTLTCSREFLNLQFKIIGQRLESRSGQLILSLKL